jgi:predicted nucleotidyltransferase
VLSAAQIDLIKEHLDGRFGLDTLWLFGSEAMGSAGPFSDIDLADLFRSRPSAWTSRSPGRARRMLGRDVDLVDLERASPIVAMQVLRHGRLLVDANPRRRHQAVSGTASRYEDLRIVRREAERAMLARIRNGRS